METGERDENISWRAAAVIMGLATIFTLSTRLLGIDPFTLVFDLFIIYLPTSILLGAIVFRRLREPRTSRTG